jgi:hypothetical protein
MNYMEQKSTPEATLHAYKTNYMKNNKRVRNSCCILMSAEPYAASILYGVKSIKKA